MTGKDVKMSRVWAMPSADTFSIQPIADLLDRWLPKDGVIVDPFARNSKVGTFTNDLDPTTEATYHMDAEDFCHTLVAKGVVADATVFDPPYSNEQISRTYRGIGREVTTTDTQNGALYARARNALVQVLKSGGIAVSFGWNSAGFGRGRGFEMLEILLVCHGGAHFDTICVVERKVQATLEVG